MRALLLALVLVGLFLLAALGQERWTERLRRTRDLALEHPVSTEEAPLDEGWSLLVVGRPSGTEPLVRVMVEAATPEQAEQVADRLVDAVRRTLPS